ncbi:MAG: PQQ-dependent sugar dehydrogenase [Clostridiaceae bacterium]
MKKLFYVLPISFLFFVACTGNQVPVTPETPLKPPIETPIESPINEPVETLIETPTEFIPKGYELVDAFPKLQFNEPLYLTSANNGSNLLYVVERTGRIMMFKNSPETERAEIFLDLSEKVFSNGQEQGLLGLTFDPEYKSNGYFYVNYTTAENTVIARYSISKGNPMIADSDSEKILLTFKQPYANHNGGQLEFGKDGYLYIGTGDGGSGGDPMGNAQNLKSYLGKILRIDVHKEETGKPYGIPTDNPFKDTAEGFYPEIYAYGLRNPWRFSFDHNRKLLIVADVGQNELEEIDLAVNGGNYGWNIYEGTKPYKSDSSVDTDTLIMPIHEYPRNEGKSITGGYVYYGSKNKSLLGTYIYGDFVSGKIWALWFGSSMEVTNHELISSGLNISSFGLDEAGEIYIIDFNGKIYSMAETN